MSIMQVANIHFDANGNNQIKYANGSLTIISNNTTVFSNTVVDTYAGYVRNSVTLTPGSYMITTMNTAPSGFVSVDRSLYTRANYPELGDVLSITPYIYDNWYRTSRGYEPAVSGAGGPDVITGITYGAGKWVATSGFQTNYSDNIILHSANLTYWNYSFFSPNTAIDYSGRMYAVDYYNSLFIAVGGNSTVSVIQTSTDAITWTNRTPANTSLPIYAIAHSESLVVAVGGNTTTGIIQTSTDGITWNQATTANNSGMYAITFGNNVFVAGGSSGAIQTSTNGTTWVNQTTANSGTISAISYGNGVYVAVGSISNSNGTIQSSTDGVTWVNRTRAQANAIYSAAYGNGIFVAGGANAQIQKSTDGTTWVSSNTTGFGSGIRFNTLYYAQNTFLGGANSFTIYQAGPDIYGAYDSNTYFRTPPYDGTYTNPINNNKGVLYVYMKT